MAWFAHRVADSDNGAMLDGPDLLGEIETLAAAEGLSPAAAVPLTEAGDDRYRRWLDDGFAGDMGYLERHAAQRIDPAAHFAPYRSVVVFIAEYDGRNAPSPDPTIGNISRYALGDDYHDVLKKKLHRVLDRLRDRDADIEGRALVDTAPVLEKVAAARAGLGWQGKHTNVIREDRGSWFFLAEILINRDLPTVDQDAKAIDRCGICTACIDACPTGAIVAPYRLDARLCISYLTIELRGSIPVELRPMIGNRIFGCDDCQEVCPWNRFATESPMAEFRARPDLRERTLVEWMEMDLETWRKTFRKSAVKRTKYEGFRRNVAVALGNAGDAEAVPTLIKALGDESPVVREHVVWALGRIGDSMAGVLR